MHHKQYSHVPLESTTIRKVFIYILYINAHILKKYLPIMTVKHTGPLGLNPILSM